MGKWILGIILAIAGVLGIISLATKTNPPTQQTDTQQATGITQYPTQIPNNILQAQPTPTLAAQAIQFPVPQNEWVTNATTAVIATAKGNIVIKLYPQDAPKTVTNFATLAKLGYYNGLTFHRVEDWVIQGGDPSGNGTGGVSIYGPTFEDELNASSSSYMNGYKAGVVAMANRGPATNGSQFFILKTDYPLNHNYTIFGQVVTGMDVVQKIAVGDKMAITAQ